MVAVDLYLKSVLIQTFFSVGEGFSVRCGKGGQLPSWTLTCYAHMVYFCKRMQFPSHILNYITIWSQIISNSWRKKACLWLDISMNESIFMLMIARVTQKNQFLFRYQKQTASTCVRIIQLIEHLCTCAALHCKGTHLYLCTAHAQK